MNRWIALGLSMGCMLGGCYVEPYPGRNVVVVEQGHLCTDGCSHYYGEGRWYATEGHCHGPDCGHVLRGGIWVRK
jgi:hypothetical protein